ncbi:TPA: mechanosensitive ion channel domain-containing protein [Serratia odorifera]|jgi:miniconductance mechanosensitive channel|uniref:mechanosensitive ion channel family protein n=1 Tax=Serratia odorifera TaxID=618 RepID=UPI0018E725BC|nr:mechanosensitive ion channel domain-containing protein [Serratia odorifera]MBJ2064624.1 mechanosensitive ion channel [Serratia odorifera]HEJ9094287.1 mechanosensitive ion channel [Serratia odorifera]
MQTLLFIWDWLKSSPFAFSLLAVVFMLFTAFVTAIICKLFLLGLVRRFILHSHKHDPLDKDMRVARRLTNIIPVVTFYFLSRLIPGLPPGLLEAISTICGVLFIINATMLINELLDITNTTYIRRHGEKAHSIKGYVQIGKIIVSSIATILVIATLSNKSPVIIISSLGAVAAVLMLVFQHTLTSLVANIQVSSSNVIQTGDWIEIAHGEISGEVVDIALHTITIRNWDNTLSRVPTKNLITETYTNWQPMFSSGGRRIKRSFFVDQSSVTFADTALLERLTALSPEKYVGLKEYLSKKMATLSDEQLSHHGITNLGLFRKYLLEYLKGREDIRKDMYLVVRQLSPTSEGLPIEIYCFSSNVFWENYEETQSEIFEYMYATARYFSLGIYQKPSGTDVSNMLPK